MHDGSAPRRTRAAFVYEDPRDPAGSFAECWTCRDYHPGPERCRILGPEFHVPPRATCALYVRGPADLDDRPAALVTPAEANFSRERPRCENCVSLSGETCMLFERLNTLAPELFALDSRVHPQGCCNAQVNKQGDRS